MDMTNSLQPKTSEQEVIPANLYVGYIFQRKMAKNAH